MLICANVMPFILLRAEIVTLQVKQLFSLMHSIPYQIPFTFFLINNGLTLFFLNILYICTFIFQALIIS